MMTMMPRISAVVDVDAVAEELNEAVDDGAEVFTKEQRCQQKLFTFRPGSGVKRTSSR